MGQLRIDTTGRKENWKFPSSGELGVLAVKKSGLRSHQRWARDKFTDFARMHAGRVSHPEIQAKTRDGTNGQALGAVAVIFTLARSRARRRGERETADSALRYGARRARWEWNAVV